MEYDQTVRLLLYYSNEHEYDVFKQYFYMVSFFDLNSKTKKFIAIPITDKREKFIK
jgi:hypothetical protein